MLKKLKGFHLVIAFLLTVFFLWAFGIFGNIRSGDSWNDSSYIIRIAKIDLERYPSFLPKEFCWAYIYLISPLGNLNNQVVNGLSTFDLNGLLYYIFPDALSNRLFPLTDNSFFLEQPHLTVCTGFAGVYKYGGYFGMLLIYVCLSLMVFGIGYLTQKNKYFTVANALLCCITILMFFDDFVHYTGLTFSLFYTCVPLFEYSKKSKTDAASCSAVNFYKKSKR